MSTKTITIQGVTVEIAAPYEEGHTITAAEAKALNQVRAENIRNNQAAKVKEILERAGGDAETAQAEVQKTVAEYDAAYEFTLASVGGGRAPVDPLAKEATSIARAYISAKLREMGVTQKAYAEQHGEDAIKNKIAELAEHPEVVKQAKKNLAEREKLAAAGLSL